MAETQPFEIPRELRELAEKNVEQARAAYGQFMDALAQAMAAWSKVPSNVITSGFKAVQERAIHFAKENAETSFELAQAKDLQTVLSFRAGMLRTRCAPTPFRRRSSAGSWQRLCGMCRLKADVP